MAVEKTYTLQWSNMDESAKDRIVAAAFNYYNSQLQLPIDVSGSEKFSVWWRDQFRARRYYHAGSWYVEFPDAEQFMRFGLEWM